MIGWLYTIACAIACSVPQAPSAAESYGIVTFRGQPVPGATVTATQGEQRIVSLTDQDGVYRLRDLGDGVWTIDVEMQGFVALRHQVTIPATHGAPTPAWELTMKSLAEITAGLSPPAPRAGLQPPVPRPNLPVQSDDPQVDAAADGFVINGSVNNAAASPFAQLRAFGNNRPQGGARYSGSLGLVGGHSRFDARPFSFSDRPSAKPAYGDLHVVAILGGPARFPRLKPDNARFFVGYQASDDHIASTESAVMPTLRERSGDFSRSVDATGQPVQVRDPRTGNAIDVIPPEFISPQAARLLRYFPLPNLEGGGRYNYQAPVVKGTRQHNVQFRWIQTVGRNLFSAAVAYQRTGTDTTSIWGFADARSDAGLDSAVNWNRRLTPTVAIRLRHQYTRVSDRVTPHFANRTNVSGEAGIAGNDQDPANWGPPRILLPNVATLMDAQFESSRARTHAGGVEIYLNRRRHNITIGGNIRRHHTDVVSQQDPRGTLAFTGAVTGVPLADFLVGIPTAISIGSGNADRYFRSSSFDAYVNDDARLTPVLTVTFGVRWEYEAPITEANGGLVNLDVAPGFTAISPVAANRPMGALTNRMLPASLVYPDKRGFQPRLALAWRPVPASSLVVRAGYGIYRNTGVYLPIAMLLSQQPPLSKTFRMVNSASDLRGLGNAFALPPAGTPNTFAVDPLFRVGYAHNWQVSVQRDLPASLLVSASYLGSRGSRLPQQVLPNTYPPGVVDPCPACPAGFTYLTSAGSSSRHAARVLVRRRLRNGLAASAQYTLAKATDDASSFSSVILPGAAVAQDWLHPDAERAPSSFDQRHQLAVQFEYTTGAGRSAVVSMNGRKGSLLKGWVLASQLTAGSGRPATPLYLAPVPGTGVVGVRPDLTGAPVDDRPPGYYVNPAAYGPPAPGRWGTAGRNSMRGPAQFTCDASLARPFSLGERFTLEWRVDITNALNRVTYAAINTVVANPQFGLPTAANPMRKVQTGVRLRF